MTSKGANKLVGSKSMVMSPVDKDVLGKVKAVTTKKGPHLMGWSSGAKYNQIKANDDFKVIKGPKGFTMNRNVKKP